MDPTSKSELPNEKSNAYTSSSELPADSPPPYTPQPQLDTSAFPSTSTSTSLTPPTPSPNDDDDRNPTTLSSPTGPKKVFTTYHIYLDANYLRTFTGASVQHLNSPTPSYRFTCPTSGPDAGLELMHAITPTSTTHLSTATFEKDFGRSTVTFLDGRVASISVVPRASLKQETRVFRVDVENVRPEEHRHPSTLFWEMGTRTYGAAWKGVGNYELIDEEGKAYAVLLTAHHKSLKKLGRLHFLVEPQEELVEVVLGSLLAVWKKADRDVRSGHVGLRT